MTFRMLLAGIEVTLHGPATNGTSSALKSSNVRGKNVCLMLFDDQNLYFPSDMTGWKTSPCSKGTYILIDMVLFYVASGIFPEI